MSALIDDMPSLFPKPCVWGASYRLPYFTRFSGKGLWLFPPNGERLAARHIQLHSRIAHSKRSKDGHLAHYELVRIQIRPLSSDTPDIWALLPFLPPFYRCESENHRHKTFSF